MKYNGIGLYPMTAGSKLATRAKSFEGCRNAWCRNFRSESGKTIVQECFVGLILRAIPGRRNSCLYAADPFLVTGCADAAFLFHVIPNNLERGSQ